MSLVLATLFIRIHDVAVAIRPIVPASADRLLEQMGIPVGERTFATINEVTGWYENLRATGFRLSQPQGVFPRLEMPADEAAQ